jgi:GT2 family glycosyltransferase
MSDPDDLVRPGDPDDLVRPGRPEDVVRPVLAVVPVCLRAEIDAELALRCLVSLWQTAPEVSVVVVDAGSAAPLAAGLSQVCAELGHGLIVPGASGSFARAVNAGLALAGGRDVVLVHPDVEFVQSGWLDAMLANPASVVGARLVFPSGLLQHCGYAFSLLHQRYEPRFLYGPQDLVESLEPAECPVSAALKLIRHECLEALGGYDERYPLGCDDLDFCLRAAASGRTCAYEPAAAAVHHHVAWPGCADGERDRLRATSLARLIDRYGEAA